MTRALHETPYEGPQSFGATYGEHRRALELTPAEYGHLEDRVRYNGWGFTLFATACDIQSVDDLEEHLDPPIYKIASRDLDNLPLLEHVAKTGKPVILSTGMASRQTYIPNAVDTIYAHAPAPARMVLLYCVSKYPTQYPDLYLPRIAEMRERFGVPVGISDHTTGYKASLAALGYGACVIEKHFTLSRAMPGTDHAASLEPTGLQKLVRDVRHIEEAIRPGPPPDVSEARRKLGRSLVTARMIRQGETITEAVLVLKSPGTGTSWHQRYKIVDHQAACDIPADVTIQPEHVVETQPAYAGP
jgi:sialic acid synthase SpsE